ncbi:MAG TPA: phosphoenolpyruvate carboxykinase [Chloroflexota bacterium]|jgi:phosphoenolpyruvate carboxykinase (ATP)|nr:phosphoenolpyruvate carboxykinase [Chloroflexota bacterium]
MAIVDRPRDGPRPGPDGGDPVVSPAEHLARLGVGRVGRIFWNLSPAALYEEVIGRGEARLAEGGAISATTGLHTGRSPEDKFVVREPSSQDRIWWGPVNRPLDQERFRILRQRLMRHLEGKDLFVQDLAAAADPRHRIGVRVVTEQAWHGLFARNLLLRPSRDELVGFRPDFTIVDVPSFAADPAQDGVRSSTVIALNFAERIVLIGGTGYAGEIKKSVFTLLNYLLPLQDVVAMHCSANLGPNDDVALFFGLSGTGKTTLSADPSRRLIGDDEHGWSDRGVFNFEGGCYAKVIRLSPTAEPEIYATTRRFGTVLENVVLDPVTREPCLDDETLTENTRSAYPIDFIPNAVISGLAGHPTAILFLAADAFGVLPPIARLTPDQAMYHFLSGYTAQVAGTEVGLGAEPRAVFSACFGQPFLPLHPTVYARQLGEKIDRHRVRCYLVNTGWSGGPFGVGSRMPIELTRALVRAALEGKLEGTPTRREPFFGLHVPTACPDVPSERLDPRRTWAEALGAGEGAAAYDEQARKLTAMFRDNFAQFGEVDESIRRAGPPV